MPELAAAERRALERAVEQRADALLALTSELVRVPSVLGAEEPAQDLVAQRLAAAGFAVRRVVPDAQAALADPHGGYPALPYEGRTCVIGVRPGEGGGRSLHLNGHVDVVPVEHPEAWARDPWGGELDGGRLWGRGAGDMKGAIAAYLVAVEAAASVRPLRGDVVFSTVIEEECGGNGMRAVLDAGVRADACLIGEPTGLAIAHGGVGLIWFRLLARSAGAHVGFAEPHGPVDDVAAAVTALRSLEAALNEPAEGEEDWFAAHEHPYNLNLGVVEGGAWPSSVPCRVELRGRLGFGPKLDPQRAQELVRRTLREHAPAVEVRFDGFRAPAYRHDPGDALGRTLAGAHEAVHGAPPARELLTFTTDARQVAGPCLCYGPLAGNIHGTDEWVDIASLRQTALAVALLVAQWCG